ncbi:HGxxPAAW family protein [Rothia sp. P6271]|uniref:HGxxPAAW family protein n=1 Tax=unclassified Rothia (in: high G+C Gram-positive bacteria) TaxID=2689056 RepID=UPI003AC6DF20
MAKEQIVLSPEIPYPNHGNTVASWGMFSVMILGALISALGFDFGHPFFFWLGLGVIVLGAFVGWALKAAGYGQGGAKTKYTGH